MKICKLKPPSPKELGWSKSGALGSRAFFSSDEKTWEDWEKYVKKHYPIRYFIFEAIPDWFDINILYPLNRVYWYLRDKLITKYYLLDLRQGYNGYDDYSHGFVDCDKRMLFACFNSLKDYIEKEKPRNLLKEYSVEEIRADSVLLSQQNSYDEAHRLYNYWMDERRIHQNILDSLRKRVRKMDKNDPLYKVTKTHWFNELERFDKIEDEMLLRLIKIRRYLWT